MYFKHIKLLLLPNDLTLFNNVFCYDKITNYNTVYIMEHILTCFVDSNILVHKIKKSICIDKKCIFFCKILIIVIIV